MTSFFSADGEWGSGNYGTSMFQQDNILPSSGERLLESLLLPNTETTMSQTSTMRTKHKAQRILPHHILQHEHDPSLIVIHLKCVYLQNCTSQRTPKDHNFFHIGPCQTVKLLHKYLLGSLKNIRLAIQATHGQDWRITDKYRRRSVQCNRSLLYNYYLCILISAQSNYYSGSSSSILYGTLARYFDYYYY